MPTKPGYLTPGVRSAPVQAAGGAAVLDVAAALAWVRRNVAAFGGDPRRVTLAGHAAGAALVNAMLMMPDSKGNIVTWWLVAKYQVYLLDSETRLMVQNNASPKQQQKIFNPRRK